MFASNWDSPLENYFNDSHDMWVLCSKAFQLKKKKKLNILNRYLLWHERQIILLLASSQNVLDKSKVSNCLDKLQTLALVPVLVESGCLSGRQQ